MGTVASINHFQQKSREEALEFLDRLRQRVESQEIDSLIIVAFPEDFSESEIYAINACDLDYMEAMGVLETAKLHVFDLWKRT
jgi:tRNA A37 methylthiotransferase MiaB